MIVSLRNDLDIPPQIKGREVKLVRRSNVIDYAWITPDGYHIKERWIKASRIPELYKQKLKALL